MKKKKVSIAIPMQQHSFRTAVGLINHGLLDKYYTTVYYDKHSFLLRLLTSIMPSDLSNRLKGRRHELIDGHAVTYFQIIGLLNQFIVRFPLFAPLYEKVSKWLFAQYANRTAKDIKSRQTDIVWTFDSWALSIYQALEMHNVKAIKVLDMASTAAPIIQRIIAEEQSKNLAFSHTYELKKSMYSNLQIKDYVEEFGFADYFLSPSDWVKRSLLESGVPESKILFLPHGVNTEFYKPKGEQYQPAKKLRFLFVGRVEGAKGIDYLFEAFKQLQDEDIELNVVGSTFSWTEQAQNFSPNINILGLKRSEEMPSVYANADVFILSSLWEGSALSLMEAMAAGMPSIASSHSCAPDIIEDGVEGFVYDPYNVEQLKSYILWFVNHKDRIIPMGKAARKKIEGYSWDKYYDNCKKIIDTISKNNEK